MTEVATQRTLSDHERRQVFADLMNAQTGGESALRARKLVSRRHGIAWGELASIEAAGRAERWPPLGPPAA
jgi:hypothetical protein